MPRKVVQKAQTKPKKKRTIPTFKLRKKLWGVFSEYIRADAADSSGNCKCVTCGKVMRWKGDGLNVGHFLPQKLNPILIFNPLNVAPQCARCNMSGEGEQWLFGLYIIEKHGQDVLDTLFSLKGVPFKFTHDWLMEKLHYYSEQLKIILTTKGI